MTASASDIQIFFDNYGVALATGDMTKIVSSWNVPSLVITDENSIPVNSRNEIEDFFKAAISEYQSNGVTSTTPVVQKIDHISEHITAVQVDWEMVSHDGADKGTEHLYYVIRQHKNNFSIDFCVPTTSQCNS